MRRTAWACEAHQPSEYTPPLNSRQPPPIYSMGSKMSRFALVTAAAMVAAVVAPASAHAASPIRVETSISPDWIYFADEVTARVEVVADRTQVDASTLEVRPSFAPWEEVGVPRVTTDETAAVVDRTVLYTLRCLDVACLPRGTVVQPFRLPPVTVSAESPGGASIVRTRRWPPIHVAGRFLPPATGAVRPALALQTRAPSARFAVPPNAVAFAFDAAGALIGLVVVALVALEIRRAVYRRRHPVDTRPPLARAIDLVREAQARDADDRRRAVGHLARLLPRPDREHAAAVEIAWAKGDPSPGELGELAAAVESTPDTE